jgi:hypothetical protein
MIKMAKIANSKKKLTYCKDCIKNSETCGKDPLECQEDNEANLYFDLYNETDLNYRNN